MDKAKRDSPISQHQSCTVIYDGQCRFCVKSKEGIERLSRSKQLTTVRYIPYQSLEAELVLGSEYQPGRPEVAYWVAADGQIRRGLDAMGSWLYRFVARNRYRWFGAVDGNPR